MMTTSWVDTAGAFAEQHALPELAERLRAFETPGVVLPSGSMASLTATAEQWLETLPARIAAVLSTEVDADQAEMFGRRFAALAAILASEGGPAGALLALGLTFRTTGILDGPAPRAVRIRACVDYFYSQAAVVRHAAPDAPSVKDRALAARWADAGPGLRHALVSGITDQGPITVNLLRADGLTLDALDVRPWDRDLVRAANDRGAVAATSGGFFLYSEPDIALPCRRGDPVGALVHDGALVGIPTFARATLVQRVGQAPSIEVLGPVGLVLEWTGGGARVEAVNRPGSSVTAYNRAFGDASPADGRPAVQLVGAGVVGAGVGPMPIPLNGLVVSLPSHPSGSVTLRWEPPGAPLRAAMAGGPTLLGGVGPCLDLVSEHFAGSAPPITFSRDETFDQNLLPRLVAGLRPDRVLIMAAIEGRDFDHAPGFTLRQSAALLAALGCEHAMNLDGGSSKRMVIGGRTVDNASTEIQSRPQEAAAAQSAVARVRPVHTGVLLLR